MNTSSRMESTSRPGCIQISSATYDILEEDQRTLFTPTGGVEVKVGHDCIAIRLGNAVLAFADCEHLEMYLQVVVYA